MRKASSSSGNRILAYRDEHSPDYAPKKIELPIKESYFVQVGRGEHIVDVQIATVGKIGLIRLGIGVEAVGINVLNPGYIGFALPVSWSGDLLLNGELANKSNIYMPGDLDSLHLHSKSRVILGVTIPRQPFVETIAALRGVDTGDIMLNDRELHLSEAAGAEVRARLTAIINEACSERDKRSQREISNDVMGLLTDAYLHALPESLSQAERISRPERIVRLAEERFMASNSKPVSLADLCAAAGVGKSTLYKAFHTVCGLAPLSYFQKRRLMQARSQLINSVDERGQVKYAAMSSGFTELGRFSVEYRQLFEELPSTTLSRTGNGSSPV
jgi:AraC-like DNA-binding protein